MLRGKGRWLVAVVVVVVVSAAAVWWALPRLPGRVRAYLPEPVVALVTTPLPTALPAPTGAVTGREALALLVGTDDGRETTADGRPRTDDGRETTADGRPPTGDGQETTDDGRPPTDDGRETTADGRPPTADGEEAAAAAAVATSAAPTATPRPALPPYARVAGVPIIPQKFNNCGPTNLTLVLNSYGVDVDQFDVAAVVRPNYEDRNVSPGELVDYVNNYTGLRAAAYVGGDADTLRALLAAGLPVIIETGLEPDAATGWMGHYLTVFAYDDVTRHFSVRDTYLGPWEGEGLAGYDETARVWEQFNGAFVVVYPPQRAAAVAAALGPALADEATMWARAVERARAAARARPDDAFAWFNLGSGLTALARGGDAALAADAAAAFDEARRLGLPARMLWYQFAPYEAYLAAGRPEDVLVLAAATLQSQGGRNVEETYLYQGQALRLLGDEDGAQAALARAAELKGRGQ